MREINIILDYKNRFESKYSAVPYRSGFDKVLLKRYFSDNGFNVNYISYPEIDFRSKSYKGNIFLYCSSEDRDGNYKSYVEDIILGLELSGAILIPGYNYLKAQDNKIFMEILRDLKENEPIKAIRTRHFGTLEELEAQKGYFTKGDFVIKPSMGAASEGVSRASGFSEIIKSSKKVSRSKYILDEVRDSIRKIIHEGYISESRYRRKFIIQELINNLTGDWKVLIYDDRYYVLRRENRKNDFRASGSGIFHFEKELPEGLLDFARTVFTAFDSPNISIDIAYNGDRFYLLEFQALYFGTYTIEKSEFWFTFDNGKWNTESGHSIVEMVYANSVSNFIKKNYPVQTEI